MSSQPTHQLGLANPGGTRHANAEDLVLYALQFLLRRTGRRACRPRRALRQVPQRTRPRAGRSGRLRLHLRSPFAPGARPPAPEDAGRPREPSRPADAARAGRLWPQRLHPHSARRQPTEAQPCPHPPRLAWLDRRRGPRRCRRQSLSGEIAQRARLNVQSSELARLTADAARAHPLLDALNDPNATHITSPPSRRPNSQPLGRITYNPSNGSLIFLADDLDPLQTGKVYELWLLPADGRNPIAAAIFHPDNHGNASVILPTLPTGVAAKGFGVSIEDEGGAQTPTPPFVLSGS